MQPCRSSNALFLLPLCRTDQHVPVHTRDYSARVNYYSSVSLSNESYTHSRVCVCVCKCARARVCVFAGVFMCVCHVFALEQAFPVGKDVVST